MSQRSVEKSKPAHSRSQRQVARSAGSAHPPGQARPTGRLRELLTVGGLVVLAAILRLRGATWGLPEIYEEATPFRVAWDMWGWGPAHGFDPNPHFFKYPSLTVYLQLIGQALLYLGLRLTGQIHSALDYRILRAIDPTALIVTGRAITAMLGAALVIPTFALARRAAGRAAAVSAGLLVALSPILVEKSRVIEVDVPLALMVAIACWCAVRILDAPTRRNLLLAGAATGLAVSAKYPGLFALLPVLVAIVMARESRTTAPAESAAPVIAADGSARLRRIAGRVLIVLVAMGVVLFLTSPFLFLDFPSFWKDLAAEREHMRLGHFGAGRDLAFATYAKAWFDKLVGWPLGLASLAGLAVLAGVRRERWAIVLAAFVVPFLMVIGSWTMKADRYLLPLIPLGTVFGVAMVAQLARARNDLRGAGRAAWLVAGATVVFAVPLLFGLRAGGRALEPDSRTGSKRWMESSLPVGSFIAMEQLGPPLTTFQDVLQWDPDVRAALRERGYQPRPFAVQAIPMFQVEPERSARFYDLRLYETADYVVVTSSVRDRYAMDPARFSRQLAFYAELERRFARINQFQAAGAGPEVVVYRNPRHDRPFPARPPDPVPELPPGAPTGGEQPFYYNLGLNHEAFGHLGHAIECYQRALRYPADALTYARVGQHLASCLVRVGKFSEALDFLSRAAGAAPDPRAAEVLRETRADILKRGPQASATTGAAAPGAPVGGSPPAGSAKPGASPTAVPSRSGP